MPFEQTWEEDLGALIVGTDLLHGGDFRHPSGGAHFIAEPWSDEDLETPPVYEDNFAAELMEVGGVTRLKGEGRDQDVAAFVQKYSLRELPSRIIGQTRGLPWHRSLFIQNLAISLEVALNTGLSLAGVSDVEMPEFMERYAAGTMRPILGNTQLHLRRERLAALLKMRGFEKGYLVDRATAWNSEHGKLESAQIPTEIRRILNKVTPLALERLIVPMNVQLASIHPWGKLEEVPFDGFNFEMHTFEGKPHVTGSQAYFGGAKENGRPALRALFEYNTEYEMTLLSLVSLCLHEIMPGHYFHAVATDLASGLGVEASMPTMCSPQVTLWEGVAQNALDLLFDTREEAYTVIATLFDVEPIDIKIQYAMEDLLDAGKHDGPVLHQVKGIGEEAIKRDCEEMYALTGALPTKVWGWAAHPLVGPMYGAGYEIGRQVVGRAIQQHGRLKVARAAYNTTGALCDIATFQTMLAE